VNGEGKNTLSLVKRAVELRAERADSDTPYDQVWIVFDRDSFKADDFDNAIAMAGRENMHCAWSNEAFELWFILHFDYRDTAMSRTDYQDKITQLIGRPYQKNAVDMYDLLAELGDQNQAIAWAKKLHNIFLGQGIPASRSNPCTTVYLLIEELNRQIVRRIVIQGGE
jgi:hypothetical protein